MKTSDLNHAGLTRPKDPQALSSQHDRGMLYLPFQIWQRNNSFQADSPLENTNTYCLYDLLSFIFNFIFTDVIAASWELT